jgi:HEAT repeat protein
MRVKKVLVDVDPAGVAAGVDRELARRVVDQVLDDSGAARVDTSAQRVLRVRIERYVRGGAVGELPAGHPTLPATGSSSLALSLEVTEDGRTQLRGASLATLQGSASPDTLLDVALRDALAQIEQARATDRLDNDTLLAIVQSPSESVQRKRRALLALASRRDLRATPVAIPLLRDDDDGLDETALQALTLLADPRAVEAIIAFSERQPPAVRRQCIDAVKATDSPLAAAWLFVLSTGHPDVAVQAHARAALALLPPSARAEGSGDANTALVSAPN